MSKKGRTKIFLFQIRLDKTHSWRHAKGIIFLLSKTRDMIFWSWKPPGVHERWPHATSRHKSADNLLKRCPIWLILASFDSPARDLSDYVQTGTIWVTNAQLRQFFQKLFFVLEDIYGGHFMWKFHQKLFSHWTSRSNRNSENFVTVSFGRF